MSSELLEAYLVRPQICPKPVFIIGSPRSGTTILAHSLAQHSALWTSNESDILFHLFANGHVDKALQKSLDRPNDGWLKLHDVTRGEFLGFLGLGLNALFTSRSQGKRWIDQTPLYTLIADDLAELFPGAFFLHILRDGRRVVHSMINFLKSLPGRADVKTDKVKAENVGSWTTDFREACRTWKQYVEEAMSFCAKHPTRSLTLINETLVADPHQGFSEIFKLLQLPYEQGPIDYFRSHRINSSFPQHDRSKPPQVDSATNPWNEWRSDQKNIFLTEAAPTLTKYGLAKPEELTLSSEELTLSSYDELILRIRDVARRVLPKGGRVAVVSKGDNALLQLDGLKAEHFPQGADGNYLGHHPETSAEAITQLEILRAKGSEFLLIPDTSLWWLDHYVEFRQHLERLDAVLVRNEGCRIFALNQPKSEGGGHLMSG